MNLKRNWILFPVVLLALAGMVMLGCPDGGGGGNDKSFKVTFSANTDDNVTGLPADQTVKEGGKATAPTAAPVRAGYAFDRWDKYANGTAAWDFATDTVIRDTTLYAKWNKLIGGNLGPVTAENNAQQKGWATNGTDNKVTDLAVETLINAQYLKLLLEKAPSGTVQIIWQGDGDNWKWNEQAITSNMGVADAEKGASWDDATKTFTIELSKALKGYEALKESYKAKFFIAYYSTDFAALGIISADLIASQTPINFVFVTFDADGGNFNPEATTPVTTQEVRYVKDELMGKRKPENPLKENSKFVKWVAGSTDVTDSTPITATVTFKAVWADGTPATWTVTFATDGGSAAPDPVKVIDGRKLGKLPAQPTKEGFDFAGWFDSSDKEYTADTLITANVTLTAKWEAAAYIPTLTKPGFFYLGKFSDNQKTWATNGVDALVNNFTEATLASAKYLIVEAHTDSLNGSGGLQIAHQGGGNWDWKQTDIAPGWTGLQPTLGNYGDEHTFYIVVELATVPDWNITNGGGGAKIILNSPEGWTDSNFTFVAGYLTSVNLAKPASTSVDMINSGTTYGWFANDVAEGHD